MDGGGTELCLSVCTRSLAREAVAVVLLCIKNEGKQGGNKENNYFLWTKNKKSNMLKGSNSCLLKIIILLTYFF